MNGTSVISSIAPTLNVLNHVAVVNSASELQFYKNGIADPSGPYTAMTVPTYSTETEKIGVWADAGDDGDFQGFIDNVRVYSRSLTQADVFELYLEGLRSQGCAAGVNYNN